MLEIKIKQVDNGFILECGEDTWIFEDDDCPVGSLVKTLWGIIDIIEPGSKHDKHRAIVSCMPGLEAAIDACEHQHFMLEDYIAKRKQDEQG